MARVREIELRDRLLGDDDVVVEETLREHFEPVPQASPLLMVWCPRAALEVEPDLDAGPRERLGARLLDLANSAEHRLRALKFRRRLRRHSDWPVILSEGDSWVAHPFLFDLTDRLLDEDHHHFNVLSRGAAGDRVVEMHDDRDYASALEQTEVRAVVLSGGGNDMLVGFDGLLSRPRPASEGAARVLEHLGPHMRKVVESMRCLITDIRQVEPRVPIVVHGYDYLRVEAPGEGRFLGPYFDHMGVDDHQQRKEVIATLVDRFNEGLRRIETEVAGVCYVDLRGMVPDGQWHDEIHPSRAGFRTLGDRIAQVLGEILED